MASKVGEIVTLSCLVLLGGYLSRHCLANLLDEGVKLNKLSIGAFSMRECEMPGDCQKYQYCVKLNYGHTIRMRWGQMCEAKWLACITLPHP